MSIDVKIKKKFKGFTLDVNFSTDAGQIGILGASGCGKSMTLKCIAGIETPDSGYIVLDGQVLFDSEKKINLPPRQRNIGYLFQNYALFPTMTVLKNVEAGIREKKDKKEALAKEILCRMGLSGFEERYPDELSGGQQQRVALARMLAAKPQMILLDEPFSALDSYLKDTLLREMKAVVTQFDGHVVMVSHSRDELYRLCSHMAVMDRGRVLHIDETKVLFENPLYVQAARLTGCKNISEIERISAHEVYAKAWGIKLITKAAVTEDISHIGIRAHYFKPESAMENAVNTFEVQLEEVEESPFELHYFMKNIKAPDSKPVWWKAPACEGISVAENTKVPEYLSIAPEHIMLLKKFD